MGDNLMRKCYKCGISPRDEPEIKLYRFPKPGSTNMRRCEMWAKYCFPEEQWSCPIFQRKLFAEHKMLCNKHFKDIEFINITEKKLSKHAVPDFDKLQSAPEPVVSSCTIEQKPGPSRILTNVTNIQYQKLQSAPEPVVSSCTIEQKPGPSRILTNVTNIQYQKLQSAPEPVVSSCTIEQKPGPSRILTNVTNIQYQKVSKALPSVGQINTTENMKNSVLYRKCRRNMRTICQLRKKISKLKATDALNVLNDHDTVKKLMKRLTPSFSLLLQSQIRNIKRKHKGRRWTMEDKILALRLYKRSATCYRLLRRLWCLPAPSTLKCLLGQFHLNAGINNKMFEVLKEHINSQPPSDNEYLLMFDEMSIKKHLIYNHKHDRVEGYQDHGLLHERSPQEATHALVFMVTGIRKKIKQPIAFYLSSSYVTADRLIVLIKEVLRKCFDIGMSITATVCDMDGVNRRALANLGASKDYPCFQFDNKEIVAIFDAPHLLKCFRNLFMKHDLKCTANITSDNTKGQGIAKWSHIQQFYDLDNTNPNFVFAPTLKKEHLNPNTRQKMKVKLAAQVLSHSVAAGMFAKISQGELTSNATVTAEVVAKMDKLFDCVNSDSSDLRRGKPVATNITTSSPHFKIFAEMKNFFNSMEFVGSRSPPPSQIGWIWTINGIIKIYENLKRKHGIKTLATRRLQQDPLENLFGCIRGNCGANSNPTSVQFIAGFKTTIMSNLAHITAGNCQQDHYKVIANFKKILATPFSTNVGTDILHNKLQDPFISDTISSIDNLFEANTFETGEMQACAYVCGFLLKKMKNKCLTCDQILKSPSQSNLHIFIDFKEYDGVKKCLRYASKELVTCVENCATLCNQIFLTSSYYLNLKKYTIEKCFEEVDFKFMSKCDLHYIQNVQFILSNVFEICIKRYCILKNRQFSETASNLSLKRKINILKHD